ncbi:sugar transporter stl1 [Fusarium albosuccineum]|uniref:Sugar transporter stl1 n=1 Tax=Fusarium albosuccineum TaxID=1237068 RepID=A0A8H4P3D0_9HYPO|nr:sugar transporter stl1 [Fusarium albosuccineum]
MELQGQSLILTVSVLTSLGFMLIGYDNGLMGGLVNTSAFQDTFDSPNSDMIVGCFFGAVFAAIWGEKLGRRRSVLVGCVVMIIGAVLQAASYTRAMMIVGRIVSGLGLGTVNSTIPVMQAEFSPKSSRGIYVCAQLSTLNFGIFLVYWIDYALSSHQGSYAWRVPVILQCVPSLVIIVSWPSFRKPLVGTSEDDPEVQRLHSIITQTVAYETSIGSGSWKDLLKEDSIKSRKRLLLACGIQSFQQLGGINAIIYYSSTLFQKSIGFDPRMSALMSGFLQTWFFVASFIPWFLIDRIGRKPLLLSMISVMAAAMAVQAGLIFQVENNTASAHAAGIGAAAMLFVFQGAFTVGSQATVWVYPSEILPLRLRQRGSSISTAANWIFNYAICQILQEKQQLCLQRCSLSGDLVAVVEALKLDPSMAEAHQTLKRLLDQMVHVEQRACQLESEESNLWEQGLDFGGSEKTESQSSNRPERLDRHYEGLEYDFAFPWVDEHLPLRSFKGLIE